MKDRSLPKLIRLALLPMAASLAWGQANPTPPALPRSVPQATQPAVTGSVVPVHDAGNPVTNGTNLLSAYNAASCGSQIVLDAGVEYRASFTFNKQCSSSSWIQVVSAKLASIPIPTYATAAQANNQNSAPAAPNSANFAKLTSGSAAQVLGCTDSANVPAKYNYFAGLEITNSVSSGLVSCTNALNETLLSQFPDHVIFDRIYAHGVTRSTTVFFTRAFLITGSNVSIVNSYVADIYSTGQDTQAILLAYGPGPYLIHNNFLEAAAENIMAGGTGRTPGYSCTIAASPAPTTTKATVQGCVDATGVAVSTPAIGTCVMLYTSSGSPAYTPDDWTCITANTGGALTFNAIPSAPISGARKIAWGMVPADITITQNVLYKPPTWNPANSGWDGITRTVKDLFEIKYGARWLIDGNIMQHTWNGGQQSAWNINSNDQNGDCPWCVSSDVTISNNLVQDITGAFGIIPAQSYSGPAPGPLSRVLIKNNLLWPSTEGTLLNISSYIVNGGSTPAGSRNGVDSLQIIHNTFLGRGTNIHVGGSGMPQNYTNLVIKDNITEFDQYRWANSCFTGPDGPPCINSTLNTNGTSTISNNAIINSGAINGDQGVNDATLTSRYGSMVLNTYYDTTQGMNYIGAPFVNYLAINTDYHNFGLTGSGAWRNAASDGTDPGVNLAQLDAALVPNGATCDLNNDGVVNVLDVQLITNQALGTAVCTGDLDGTGSCTIVDVQRVVNAALGLACRVGP